MSKKKTQAENLFRLRRLQVISKAYLMAKNKKEDDLKICEEDSNNYNDYSHFVLKVEKVFESMDSVSKEIINNDFFFQSYPFWWVKVYSRTTYYRLKSQAIREFMEVYEKM